MMSRGVTYPKLSSDDYTYVVQYCDGGSEIILTQVPTGKKARFFQAGAQDHISMMNHMNSLTDDLCSQWFNERVKKSKAKPTESK